MLRFCAAEQPVELVCAEAGVEGRVPAIDPRPKITYIDTSNLMKYQMPGTKGVGHSDIYRPAIGRLLWQLLDGDEP